MSDEYPLPHLLRKPVKIKPSDNAEHAMQVAYTKEFEASQKILEMRRMLAKLQEAVKLYSHLYH